MSSAGYYQNQPQQSYNGGYPPQGPPQGGPPPVRITLSLSRRRATSSGATQLVGGVGSADF
ncbi:uncharacterized protein TERG_06248 [Trichophyton rubrum CBS 118892]|uniref:Uncharacterized protein n=1 Tax=Trichophyton rubrum (strain ATCC MYA-4607 / CBS 118892) TaxID=559305 RepID=F2SUV2_TRIRC|nr:uncharacterized protein TERG_06248 [Trichophyton rubrum CBS 118892]EGD90014.2 hypothetical protein TERG_06248 [Trichophyton rubrum CBS 118892]